MTLTPEGVERAFAERVGRPIDSEQAKSVADAVAGVIDDLNEIDPEPLAFVEPNTIFEAAYPEQERMAGWQRHENSSPDRSAK